MKFTSMSYQPSSAFSSVPKPNVPWLAQHRVPGPLDAGLGQQSQPRGWPNMAGVSNPTKGPLGGVFSPDTTQRGVNTIMNQAFQTAYSQPRFSLPGISSSSPALQARANIDSARAIAGGGAQAEGLRLGHSQANAAQILNQQVLQKQDQLGIFNMLTQLLNAQGLGGTLNWM